MTEIKPCPSGHAISDLGFDDEFEAHVIRCMECNWRTWGHTELECITAWNQRVPDPALLTGLREAREALRNILSDEEVALPRPDYEATRATLAHLDTLLAQEGQP